LLTQHNRRKHGMRYAVASSPIDDVTERLRHPDTERRRENPHPFVHTHHDIAS
jgi:hypothetical protein